MDKHCPVFILECAATFICENFLSGTLPLETICKKVRDHIVTEYKELPIEDLQDIAEAFKLWEENKNRHSLHGSD